MQFLDDLAGRCSPSGLSTSSVDPSSTGTDPKREVSSLFVSLRRRPPSKTTNPLP